MVAGRPGPGAHANHGLLVVVLVSSFEGLERRCWSTDIGTGSGGGALWGQAPSCHPRVIGPDSADMCLWRPLLWTGPRSPGGALPVSQKRTMFIYRSSNLGPGVVARGAPLCSAPKPSLSARFLAPIADSPPALLSPFPQPPTAPHHTVDATYPRSPARVRASCGQAQASQVP